jgi:hypothetical protein
VTPEEARAALLANEGKRVGLATLTASPNAWMSPRPVTKGCLHSGPARHRVRSRMKSSRMRSWVTAFCILAPLSVAGCDAGPTQRSAGKTVELTSVRYVRTRPVVDPQKTLVGLAYTIPRPDDYLGRPKLGEVALRALDDGITFVYDHPNTFDLPVNLGVAFYIDDEAVSSRFVARDIYVNGTKLLRVQGEGANETASFTVDEHGNVH